MALPQRDNAIEEIKRLVLVAAMAAKADYWMTFCRTR